MLLQIYATAEERWRACLSQPMTRRFQWVTDMEIVQVRPAIECSVYQGRSRCATFGLALFCWKTALDRPIKYGKTTVYKMSEMY